MDGRMDGWTDGRWTDLDGFLNLVGSERRWGLETEKDVLGGPWGGGLFLRQTIAICTFIP